MISEAAARAAAAVDGARLVRRHEELAAIGRIEPRGLDREAFSDADIEARRLLLSWAAARGHEAYVDEIGNTFVVRPGREEAAPIVTGSHIDSQPAGGPYDGQFGVLAAFETLEALDDAGIVTRRPVWAVVWSNEEGSRFQPTTMGSAVFAGAIPIDQALSATDTLGLTVRAELARMMDELGLAARPPASEPFHAYVEAHIEQGPILDREQIPIGIVTSIQGLRWFTIRVTGATGHAGSTPAAGRRDALAAAVRMVSALTDLMHDPDDVVRFTVGRFEVHPNSPNTIPGEVLFTIDFRHPDSAVLARLGDQVRNVCEQNALGCSVEVEETLDAPPTLLDQAITERIREVTDGLGYPRLDLVSGATHDAKYVALTCPSGMLFIPSRDGLSHTVLEYSAPEQIEYGTRVLAGVIASLATD